MPQIEPNYEEIPEFLNIADSLIRKYPAQFDNIDLSKVACVGITNKNRSEKKSQLWELKPVKPPMSMYSTKEYIVIFFMNDWEELDRKYQSAITADVMFSIPPGGKGQVIPMDYKDHGVMLRTLGVDYMDNVTLPDILTNDISWKT